MTKTQIKNRDRKRIAKKLKKANLINYDLRKNLTRGQKRQLNKLWKDDDWKRTLNDANTVFRTVSKKTAKKFKDIGYKTSGRRVYINSEGYPSVHIKKDNIVKSDPDFPEKVVKDLLVPDRDILDTLKRLTGKKLPRGVSITVRIGSATDRDSFSRIKFKSYEELLNYLSKWQPRDKFESRDNLISQMSIVEIKDQ